MQSDATRMQSEAFRMQSEAFRMQSEASRMHPEAGPSRRGAFGVCSRHISCRTATRRLA